MPKNINLTIDQDIDTMNKIVPPCDPEPDYQGGDMDNMVCFLSNPLVTLVNTPLTLAELKIVNAYIGKINPLDPEKYRVRFTKGEFEELIGVTKLNTADMKKRLKHLFQAVTITDKNDPDHFVTISLFDIAEPKKDKNGCWQIDLACGYSARKYIFNVENTGYLRYYLSNIIKLRSRYSYAMFLYINRHLTMHNYWTVKPETLKEFLGCTSKTYEKYFRFNETVLKKCKEELNEKTDIQFTYKTIYNENREAAAIRFEASKKVPVSHFDGQANKEQCKPVDELMEKILHAVIPDGFQNPYFTAAQLRRIHREIIKGSDIIPENQAIGIVKEAFTSFYAKKEELKEEIIDDAAYFYRTFSNLYDETYEYMDDESDSYLEQL